MAEPDPKLLKKAIDDRDAHPWRYYRFDHDEMTRLCEKLAGRAEAAEGQLVLIRAEEREACAKIADSQAPVRQFEDPETRVWDSVCRKVAAAIRDRETP